MLATPKVNRYEDNGMRPPDSTTNPKKLLRDSYGSERWKLSSPQYKDDTYGGGDDVYYDWREQRLKPIEIFFLVHTNQEFEEKTLKDKY